MRAGALRVESLCIAFIGMGEKTTVKGRIDRKKSILIGLGGRRMFCFLLIPVCMYTPANMCV